MSRRRGVRGLWDGLKVGPSRLDVIVWRAQQRTVSLGFRIDLVYFLLGVKARRWAR